MYFFPLYLFILLMEEYSPSTFKFIFLAHSAADKKTSFVSRQITFLPKGLEDFILGPKLLSGSLIRRKHFSLDNFLCFFCLSLDQLLKPLLALFPLTKRPVFMSMLGFLVNFRSSSRCSSCCKNYSNY